MVLLQLIRVLARLSHGGTVQNLCLIASSANSSTSLMYQYEYPYIEPSKACSLRVFSPCVYSSRSLASSIALFQSYRYIYTPSLSVMQLLPTAHPAHNPTNFISCLKHKNSASGTAIT